MAKHWIAGAIKHPGALHKSLGVPEGENIKKSVLAKAASKGGKLGQRARLAETLSHMHHGAHHSEHEGDGHHASMHHGGHHEHTVNVHLHMAPKGKKKFSL